MLKVSGARGWGSCSRSQLGLDSGSVRERPADGVEGSRGANVGWERAAGVEVAAALEAERSGRDSAETNESNGTILPLSTIGVDEACSSAAMEDEDDGSSGAPAAPLARRGRAGVVDLDGACMCIELTRQCCRCDTSPDGVSSTGWLAVSADATPTRTRKHGDTMK